MNKQTIIRYFQGALTSEEKLLLFKWIEESKQNRDYFNIMKNLWTAGSLHSTPDVEPDFTAVKNRIQAIPRSGRSRMLRFLPYIVRIAAVLAIPLAIMLLWSMLRPNTVILPLAQEDQPMVRISTPLCARAELILPDGTKVWLNSGSELSYPRIFEGQAREVVLKGEAYFDIQHNEHYPFIVKTPQYLNVRVRGTVFNLRAYADEEDAEITLVNGAVELSSERFRKAIHVKPNQSVRYKKDGFKVVSNVNTDLYTSWKDGVLVFDNAAMPELVKRLERWYGVQITVDPRILHFSYTGKFKEETIGQVLELIRQSSDIVYKVENKHVFLSKKQ